MIFIDLEDSSVKPINTSASLMSPADEASHLSPKPSLANIPHCAPTPKFLHQITFEKARTSPVLKKLGSADISQLTKKKGHTTVVLASKIPEICENLKSVSTGKNHSTYYTKSNNLVKVKLGYLPPPASSKLESGPLSESSGIDSEPMSSLLIVEQVEHSVSLASESDNPRKSRPTLKQTLSRASNGSSKPHFTICSGSSYSNKTIKTKKEDSSKIIEGNRIDTAVDIEGILAKNRELTEYMKLRQEEAVIRQNKKFRYTRITNTIASLGLTGRLTTTDKLRSRGESENPTESKPLEG